MEEGSKALRRLGRELKEPSPEGAEEAAA